MPKQPLPPHVSSTVIPHTQTPVWHVAPTPTGPAEYFGSVLLEDITYLHAFLKDRGAVSTGTSLCVHTALFVSPEQEAGRRCL